MKHLFVVNPVAGGKKGDAEKVISAINDAVSRRGLEYEIYVTKEPMDACVKVRSEAEHGEALRVYACGGDGTLNECVNGAAELPNAAVTAYPVGTGNDFVKLFGDGSKSFMSIDELIDGEVTPMDVIKCNDRYSINICSVGIDARIGTDVHKYSGLPLIGGAMGYVISLFVNVKKGISRRMRIRTENDEYEGDFSLVCACNGSYYGGGFHPAPAALPNDGLLECIIIKGIGALKLFRVVLKYAKGRVGELGDIATYIRGKRLDVEMEGDSVINVDGEAVFSSKAAIRLVPNGVNFILPARLKNFFKDKQAATV